MGEMVRGYARLYVYAIQMQKDGATVVAVEFCVGTEVFVCSLLGLLALL